MLDNLYKGIRDARSSATPQARPGREESTVQGGHALSEGLAYILYYRNHSM